MNAAQHFGLAGLALLMGIALPQLWMGQALTRLPDPDAVELADQATPVEDLAVARLADREYCTGELKGVLRRVLTACGLNPGAGSRGCQPLEARNIASMSGDDFNALFLPLKERAAILQFDSNSDELDTTALDLLDNTFADRGGASYFLVVSRASPDGSSTTNSQLSEGRARSVMTRLQAQFPDDPLDEQVGLLWLGEEYAQLEDSFCDWRRSRTGAATCAPHDLNRSAFVAWIDCRI